MNYDSLVIGSGLSGLTCALLLARSGRKVLILEQQAQPAPVVRGFSRKGLYFDSGLHYIGGLGPGGAFQPLFHHLELAAELNLFPYSERGFDRLKIGTSDSIYSLPVGFAKIRECLETRFPAVQDQITDYLDEIEERWWRFPYLDLDSDFGESGMVSVHGETLNAKLKQFSGYPELQSLLSMHSLLYGVDPAEATLEFHSQVTGSYYHSVHGICGGGKALTDAFLRLLEKAGVTVRCRSQVTRITTDGKAVSGVVLADGEEIRAQEVIATMNPSLLPDMLSPGLLRPVFVKRLKRLRQTTSAYIVFARSRQELPEFAGSNLYVQPQAGIFSAAVGRPLEERSFYLATTRQNSPATALIGIVPAAYTEVAEFARGQYRRGRGYKEMKQNIWFRLKNMFTENCPELAEIELVELATPLTLGDYSLAPEGAIYGAGRFAGQYNPQPATRLPGLYLSGQGIAAPGLLGTVVSAYLTCGTILGHDQLRNELRRCRKNLS